MIDLVVKPLSTLEPMASFAAATGRDLVEVSHDLGALAGGGRWAVMVTFEGDVTMARFASWTDEPVADHEVGRWQPPGRGAWTGSLNQQQYQDGVDQIRERIAAGDVYQVNLCRVLSAELPDRECADPAALWRTLQAGNPAPYAGFLRLPGVAVVSASPELFLRLDHNELTSGPIKGTATTAAGLSDKDRAENVMIVDLVRNDLSRVCTPGSVSVPELLKVEAHPGLFHLTSYVSGQLSVGASWEDVFAGVFPPGSVSGAPKIAALSVIESLEPVVRGPYCGAFGWIDADAATAELAVAIRSFWVSDGAVYFGTGAGITWGSHPHQEWLETELKAKKLVALASSGNRSSGV